MSRPAFSACTLSTGACCLGAGGAGDTAATKMIWQPNSATEIWNQTNNWASANIPDVSTEDAYIQADWRVPGYPKNNYTLACLEIASGAMTTGTPVTITIAAPGSITWKSHPFAANDPVRITTTGALPAGLTAGTIYFIKTVVDADTFTVSATAGGTAITTTGTQSGTHTATPAAGVTISIATPGVVTWTAHGLYNGAPVILSTTGALPTGLTAGTVYYVVSVATNTFSLSATAGGAAINTTGTQSGTHVATSLLTIASEYFYNRNPGSLSTTSLFMINMAGANAQTFDNVDTVNNLNIANSTTVTMPSGFTVATNFTISSGAGTIKVQDALRLSQTTPLVIPASATLEIQSGAVLTAMGGITVNGVLKAGAGAQILIGNGKTLLVNSGGVLQLIGTSGNVASLDADQGASTYTLTVNGSINANNFSISRTATAGLNLTSTATVQTLSNGDFHYLASGGYAVTLSSGTDMPVPNPTGLGFYNDFAYGSVPKNFDATGFLAGRAAFTVSNWAGLGGATSETDPQSKVNWGTQAAVALQITNRTASGYPPNPIAKGATVTMTIATPGVVSWTAHGLSAGALVQFATNGALPTGLLSNTTYYVASSPAPTANTFSVAATVGGAAINTSGSQSGTHNGFAPTLFATFAFSLTGTSTPTDITSLTLQLGGTNTASDVSFVQLFNDTNGNCAFDAGTDVQIGSNVSFAGSPWIATLPIPAATVTVSDTTNKCVHVLVATNPNAATNDTIQIKIAGTSDVANSQAYSFSNAGGPPVQGNTATITGAATKIWGGGNGPRAAAQNWNTNPADWTPSGAPASTDDCQIGPAFSFPSVNGSYTCTNLTLPDSGTLSWGGSTNILTLLGALTLGNTYVFNTATAGFLSFASSTATQAISTKTTFPGNVIINNNSSSGIVTLNSSWTVGGNLTIPSGVLEVTSGNNLTVSGNITVGSTSAVTMTIAVPAVITWASHGLAAGTPIKFSTTGALPTGLTAGTTYYVAGSPAPTATTFSVTASQGGTAITTTGTQSGTQTATTVGGTLKIDPGATITLADGKTLYVGTYGTLQMVGTISQNSAFTCGGTVTGCTVTVDGTIKAQYYSFSKLGVGGVPITSGVTINSGATIDPTYYLQNGSFTYPIGANPYLLTLNRQVPGNALGNMTFDTAGSTYTGTARSIQTNTTAGTVTVSNYSGDLTNCCTTAPTYLVVWTAPTTTLKLTTEQRSSTAVVTMTIASPGVLTENAHGLVANAPLTLSTTGALPTGFVSGTTYYVAVSPAPTANTYSLSATIGGAAINTTGTQSGVHTRSALLTITVAVPGVVTWSAHRLVAGSPLTLSTTGALPTGLAAATTYFVAASPAPTANTFSLAAASGGAAITTTGTQSGIHSANTSNVNTNQGDTSVRAGWFGFQQTQAGIYADTNITSFKVQLDGTATSSDVSSVRLYSEGTSATATITIATPGVVTRTAHGMAANAPLSFSTTGTLPTGISIGTTYYVATSPAPTANTFSVSTTIGGAAINTTGSQSGVHTVSHNPSCTGTGGTQIGSARIFVGSPPTATFSSLTGVTVPGNVTSPPKRCLYVEYDIASAATAAATVVATVNSSADVVNSASYAFNGSNAPPQSAGTITIIGNTITWVGTTSTAWATNTNWSPAVVPDNTKNCVINSATNNPIISVAGAVCKSITIGNGILTINSGQNLDLFGSLTNTGTITQPSNTATITIKDGGVATNQTLQSSSALNYLVFNKTTAGGYVYIGNTNLTINNFSIAAGKTFTFNVRNGDTLTLPNGATISSSVFRVDGGGTVAIGSGQTFLMNGTSTLYGAGTNDGFPSGTGPNSATKAIFTHSSSGTWSFQSTAGTIDLTGWIFDWLDCNGMQVGGTTTVTSLTAGQLLDLPNGCSTQYTLQLNTTGTLPATVDYFGWSWGPGNTRPLTTDNYKLGSSTGCGSQTVNFTNWFGDFSYGLDQPSAQSKVSTTTCTITIGASSSPVSLSQELKAEPYNSVVRLLWSTGLETLHQGFNVYRSTSPQSGFAQINSSLIRNNFQSGTVHGNYDFRDSGVTNDVTYYYRLEDIAANGKRTIHGPVSATPRASLGTVPAPIYNAILGVNASGGGAPSASDATPGTTTLAPGVTQVTKTNSSIRLRIDVPTLTRSASNLLGYEQLSIPGYAQTTLAGSPELPERVILVEVPASLTATFTEVSRIATPITGLALVPASTWTVNGSGTLVSSRVFDATVYSTDQSLPSVPVEFKEVIENQGLFYLPLIVHPVAYNPVQQTGNALSQITFDVHLSGTPNWNVGAPVTESGAWGYEGSLNLHIKKAGVYRLRYSDLVAAGVEGPFAGANVNRLRLFSKLGELPLQVISGGSLFSDGDEIRFFAPYFTTSLSDRNTLALYVDSVNGLRMDSLSNPPSGILSSQASFTKHFDVKAANLPMFNEPLAENAEHIYWARIYAPPTSAGDDILNTTISLPGISASGSVRFMVSVAGGHGQNVMNAVHHLKMFVNGSVTEVGDVTFQSNAPYSIAINVPATRFVDGKNSIQLQVIGDLVPAGDNDVVSIEKISVDYPHTWNADAGMADIGNVQPGKDLVLGGLTSNNISVYDITNISLTALVDGGTVTNAAGNYSIRFPSTAGDPSLGRRFYVVSDSALLSPWAIEMNPGSNLKSTTQGADVLYIGPSRLLDSVAPLAKWRRDNGFRTSLVTTESIYLEFGQGIRSPQAIKDFISYAVAIWRSPAPKYVVLIGDASYDPKNQLGFGLSSGVPIYLRKGANSDYGSDNFYVALTNGSDAPSLSLGRIPGSSPGAISAYVDKVMAYETGDARPSGEAAARISIISDVDKNGGEHFDAFADQLASSLSNQWNPLITINRLKRSALGDVALKAKILDAFNSGSTLIHYLGHGAEDRWAGSGVFTNDDADSLTNTTFPIVVAMSCLNGYFYDADSAFQSLTDRLLFNGQGGAIAMFASTSLTSPDAQAPIQNALYQILAQNPGTRLGDAVRMAKVQGGISSGTSEVTNSWTLFGDPMLKVNMPLETANVSAAVVFGPPDPAADAGVRGLSLGSGGGSCLSVHQTGKTSELPGWGTVLNLLILALGLIGGRAFARWTKPVKAPLK